jgi:hypothetical protein
MRPLTWGLVVVLAGLFVACDASDGGPCHSNLDCGQGWICVPDKDGTLKCVQSVLPLTAPQDRFGASVP